MAKFEVPEIDMSDTPLTSLTKFVDYRAESIQIARIQSKSSAPKELRQVITQIKKELDTTGIIKLTNSGISDHPLAFTVFASQIGKYKGGPLHNKNQFGTPTLSKKIRGYPQKIETNFQNHEIELTPHNDVIERVFHLGVPDYSFFLGIQDVPGIQTEFRNASDVLEQFKRKFPEMVERALKLKEKTGYLGIKRSAVISPNSILYSKPDETFKKNSWFKYYLSDPDILEAIEEVLEETPPCFSTPLKEEEIILSNQIKFPHNRVITDEFENDSHQTRTFLNTRLWK